MVRYEDFEQCACKKEHLKVIRLFFECSTTNTLAMKKKDMHGLTACIDDCLWIWTKWSVLIHFRLWSFRCYYYSLDWIRNPRVLLGWSKSTFSTRKMQSFVLSEKALLVYFGQKLHEAVTRRGMSEARTEFISHRPPFPLFIAQLLHKSLCLGWQYWCVNFVILLKHPS